MDNCTHILATMFTVLEGRASQVPFTNAQIKQMCQIDNRKLLSLSNKGCSGMYSSILKL